MSQNRIERAERQISAAHAPLTCSKRKLLCYFTWKFAHSCVAFFAILRESSKCLCSILAMLREIC